MTASRNPLPIRRRRDDVPGDDLARSGGRIVLHRTARLEGAKPGTSVLILGAGNAGVTAAYERRNAGYRVRILEYNHRPAGGAGPSANDLRLVSPDDPDMVVLARRRDMPSFAQSLDDAQVATVVGDLRTHFGNAYGDEIEPDRAGMFR